jgi:hypothetical protein
LIPVCDTPVQRFTDYPPHVAFVFKHDVRPTLADCR